MGVVVVIVQVQPGGGTTSIGWKSEGCEFNQSGGAASLGVLNVGTDVNDPGHGTATLSDSAQFSAAGAVTIGSTGTVPGDRGIGVLVLDGSKTGAGTDADAQAGLTVRTNGTLKAVIDQAAINTSTDMRKVAVTGNVAFNNGAVVLPSFDPGATPASGTWTIMTWTGSKTDNGLVIDPAADPEWSISVGASELTVTYTAATSPGTVITVR